MASRLTFAILGALIGALLMAIYALPASGPPSASPAPLAIPVAREAVPADGEAPLVTPREVPVGPAPVAVAVNTADAPADTDHAERVQRRVGELMALAMNEDTTSRETIWSELFDRDKAIRFGAVEALMQFGDHSLAPKLRQVAAATTDAAEKAHLLAAADFLSLPRLGEPNVKVSDPPAR